MKKIKLFRVTSMNFGFMLNVTILIIQINLPSRKNFLACCISTDSNITQWKDLENDHNNLLSLKPSSYLELLVNQISNATPENSNGPEKISSSKYHIEEMHNIELTQKNKLLSVFHIKVFHSIKVLLTFNILSNTKKI